jgi:hypothetical protein
MKKTMNFRRMSDGSVLVHIREADPDYIGEFKYRKRYGWAFVPYHKEMHFTVDTMRELIGMAEQLPPK